MVLLHFTHRTSVVYTTEERAFIFSALQRKHISRIAWILFISCFFFLFCRSQTEEIWISLFEFLPQPKRIEHKSHTTHATYFSSPFPFPFPSSFPLSINENARPMAWWHATHGTVIYCLRNSSSFIHSAIETDVIWYGRKLKFNYQAIHSERMTRTHEFVRILNFLFKFLTILVCNLKFLLKFCSAYLVW